MHARGTEEPYRIVVLACLVGQAVRWNGDDERSEFVADVLSGVAELVPICPEIELGLGVPREPIQLVRTAGGFDLHGVETKRDLTSAMNDLCRRTTDTFTATGPDGFLLKSRSPSCGLDGARVFESREDLLSKDGPWTRSGRGLFATAMLGAFPDRPVADEVSLETTAGRLRFAGRIAAMRDARTRVAGGGGPGELLAFLEERRASLEMAPPECRPGLEETARTGRGPGFLALLNLALRDSTSAGAPVETAGTAEIALRKAIAPGT